MHDRKDKIVLTVAQLAEKIGAELCGDGQPEITGVNTVADAGQRQVCFVTSQKHVSGLSDSTAAAVIVSEKIEDIGIAQLIVKDVNAALITALNLFAPQLTPLEGIHPAAVVEQSAKIGSDAAIGPGAYISHGATIGDSTVIAHGCSVGENTSIGANCRIDENVVIYRNCTIGNNCTILANTTIGSAGFGYSFIDGQHRMVPHNGGVVIEDCVDVGANCCIDRAKFGNTVIGAGTKIDNLCQIAHNVVLGKCCLLASMVGISGSCTFGDGVVMSGQSGVRDHINVGSGAMLGAGAGVLEDIEAGKTVLGLPAVEAKQEIKFWLAKKRLPEMVRQLKRLAKKVDKIEASIKSQ